MSQMQPFHNIKQFPKLKELFVNGAFFGGNFGQEIDFRKGQLKTWLGQVEVKEGHINTKVHLANTRTYLAATRKAIKQFVADNNVKEYWAHVDVRDHRSTIHYISH